MYDAEKKKKPHGSSLWCVVGFFCFPHPPLSVFGLAGSPALRPCTAKGCTTAPVPKHPLPPLWIKIIMQGFPRLSPNALFFPAVPETAHDSGVYKCAVHIFYPQPSGFGVIFTVLIFPPSGMASLPPSAPLPPPAWVQGSLGDIQGKRQCRLFPAYPRTRICPDSCPSIPIPLQTAKLPPDTPFQRNTDNCRKLCSTLKYLKWFQQT